MTRRLLIPALFATLGLSLAACGQSSDKAAASSEPAGASDQSAQHLKLVGNDSLKFEPMMLTAKAGHIVIDLHDSGSYPHNVRFPALDKLSKTTSGGISGKDVSLDLGNLKPGSYQFVCTFHAGAGMKGTLVVS